MSRFHNAKNRSKPILEAFVEKYEVDLETGCWNWIASRMRTGYGQFNTRDGKVVTAHRFAYQAFKGAIPDGLFVCHHCDNRRCVNPEHLWLGTCAENLRDMREKGRDNHRPLIGPENPSSKITAENAVEIFMSKEKQSALAEKFGITQAAISAIKTRKNWRHATQNLRQSANA